MEETNPVKWVRECRENFMRRFGIVAECCSEVKAQSVSTKAKVNSSYYQQNISEFIFEEKIPVLYEKTLIKSTFK